MSEPAESAKKIKLLSVKSPDEPRQWHSGSPPSFYDDADGELPAVGSPASTSTTPICRYFTQGYCAAGSGCRFDHSGSTKGPLNIPCHYNARAQCREVLKCTSSHQGMQEGSAQLNSGQKYGRDISRTSALLTPVCKYANSLTCVVTFSLDFSRACEVARILPAPSDT